MSNYDLELEYKINLETLINEYLDLESKKTLTYKKRQLFYLSKNS